MSSGASCASHGAAHKPNHKGRPTSRSDESGDGHCYGAEGDEKGFSVVGGLVKVVGYRIGAGLNGDERLREGFIFLLGHLRGGKGKEGGERDIVRALSNDYEYRCIRQEFKFVNAMVAWLTYGRRRGVG